MELLAACHGALTIGKSGAIDLARLAAHPLLVVDTSFVSRRTFDATCRLAGIEPNIVFESRTPHTLLAMAERGHGVAIVPSAVQIDRYALRIIRSHLPGKSTARALGRLLGKATPLAALRCGLLRLVGGARARSIPDFSAIRAKARRDDAPPMTAAHR